MIASMKAWESKEHMCAAREEYKDWNTYVEAILTQHIEDWNTMHVETPVTATHEQILKALAHPQLQELSQEFHAQLYREQIQQETVDQILQILDS